MLREFDTRSDHNLVPWRCNAIIAPLNDNQILIYGGSGNSQRKAQIKNALIISSNPIEKHYIKEKGELKLLPKQKPIKIDQINVQYRRQNNKNYSDEQLDAIRFQTYASQYQVTSRDS